jgi:hypothetical protein
VNGVVAVTVVEIVRGVAVIVLVAAGNLVLQKLVAGGYPLRGPMIPWIPFVHLGSTVAFVHE